MVVRGRGGERGDDQSLNWLVAKAEGNENSNHVPVSHSQVKDRLYFSSVFRSLLPHLPRNSMLETSPILCGSSSSLLADFVQEQQSWRKHISCRLGRSRPNMMPSMMRQRNLAPLLSSECPVILCYPAALGLRRGHHTEQEYHQTSFIIPYLVYAARLFVVASAVEPSGSHRNQCCSLQGHSDAFLPCPGETGIGFVG